MASLWLFDALVCAALPLGSFAAAQSTVRVSVDSNGVEGDRWSWEPSLSADGRYVGFSSETAYLVPGDTNNSVDVFVHDLASGSTVRVSVDSNGVQANAHSGGCDLSADGRYVAFVSLATNLVAGDTNASLDVFVHDRVSGTTTREGVAAGGVQATGAGNPSISADGRYVAFMSGDPGLVPGDTNNLADVFVRDRQLGLTWRVNVDSTGLQANHWSWSPRLSADGSSVAFASSATNLVSGDTNSSFDVFVHVLATGQTVRASVDANGVEGNWHSGGYDYWWNYEYYFNTTTLDISGDGRFVTFDAQAWNLVSDDTNFYQDVFVHDLQTGATTRVSVGSGDAQANRESTDPVISSDGRFVAFRSWANNLVNADSNGEPDVFVRDRLWSLTERASVSWSGVQANHGSDWQCAISSGGRFVAFASPASNLVPGDNNAMWDVFVRDRGAVATSSYCTSGTTTSGCVASIAGSGQPSATSGSGFTISVTSVEGLRPGIIFYGLSDMGFAPSPWGTSSSFLCVKPPVQRTPVQGSGGNLFSCDGTLSLDWNAFVASNPAALGHPFSAGQDVFAQGWFRDPASPKTTMLSNAISFVVGT